MRRLTARIIKSNIASDLQGELKEAQATSATITAARDTLAEEAAGLRGQLTAAQAAVHSAQVRLCPLGCVAGCDDSSKAGQQGSGHTSAAGVPRLPMFWRIAGDLQHDRGSS